MHKIVGQGLLPLGVFFLGALFAFAFSIRRRRVGGAMLALDAAFLWAFSTPVVAGALLAPLEMQYKSVRVVDSPSADAIVVLGGGVASAEPPRPEVTLSAGADRVLKAARLYRAGKAPLVVTSGGRPRSVLGRAESDDMADLLVEWGVPERAILKERESVDTRENALGTRLLASRHGFRRILLVTSAAHLPRACATFRKVGFDVVPSPSDVTLPRLGPAFSLLPDAISLQGSSAAVYERLGLAYYRLRGFA